MTDREKLMKLIDELPPHEGKTFEEALADHLIANGVKLAPVVYGQMEEIEPCDITVDRQCCSCGTPMGSQDHYCPNCGAKMDK